ncbi:MAG: SDR family oxidoreductase [Gammaproteobacteria bacterium]|nr:SDR family oxidoreductase [Gammaproteobacteria bacterium]
MGAIDLQGKRVLLTQAGDFMGPVIRDVFSELGAVVVTDDRPLADPGLPAEIVAAAGRVDVLLAHLSLPSPRSLATESTDEEWRHVFAHLVDPLPRLVRAVLPQMIERRAGKILLFGSAAALRGQKRASTYSAARGAQLAYVQTVGIEAAPHDVQVNAIAQNFVDNPTYFPAELQANPAFQERLKRDVPLGRLVGAREDALFAAYLCSEAANCFVGQVFPVCGGWVTR